MPRRQVRYAVVGLGHIAQVAVLPAFGNARRNSRLAAVVSGDPVKRREVAARYGVQRAVPYEQYDALLASGEVDAVYIALPNSMHCEYALRAARAGIHVLVEKPMALTEEECRALIEAVESSGKLLTVGFNRRFAPDYVAVKRALQRRQSPVVISCRVNSPGISGSYWMADPSIGGAILGAILGGGKGAAIGAGVGAAGGTAASMANDRNAATLPAGTNVTVRVQQPVTVTVQKE